MFCFCVCIKWVKSAKKHTKNVKYKLLTREDYDNWAQVFDKCDPEKQKYRYELIPHIEFEPCRRFVQNDLATKN